jgi:hypothetical protein
VKLCTYVHLVWASEGRGRHGGAIHWTWIDAYNTHEPIHVQEAEKESHGAGSAWPKPSISRFLGYSGPDGACKWVIWGWESGSGSCALHSRPHLMLRVLSLDMSVVVRTTFCSRWQLRNPLENCAHVPRYSNALCLPRFKRKRWAHLPVTQHTPESARVF